MPVRENCIQKLRLIVYFALIFFITEIWYCSSEKRIFYPLLYQYGFTRLDELFLFKVGKRLSTSQKIDGVCPFIKKRILLFSIELSMTIISGNMCHFLNPGYRAEPVVNGSPAFTCPDSG